MGPGPADRNLVLTQLAPEDRDVLRPRLQKVELPVRRRLAAAFKPIDAVFFIESGIASITTKAQHEPAVEVGVIGREGAVNLALVMGADRSPADALMQIGGEALKIDAEDMRAALAESETLQAVLLRCVHVFMVQTSSTVLANARATLSERLARWLLMARDRVDGDGIALTHEFLATMLGVRRPGVTEVVREFERRGVIAGGRGLITILDRDALAVAANGYYGPAETELARLFPV